MDKDRASPNVLRPASSVVTLRRAHVEEICAHARAVRPAECCGLIGGRKLTAQSLYRMRNVARDTSVAYEASPSDLFAGQRLMRERGESLVGIYHSHPRAADPVPSETDVRLAFYPEAVYLIVGFREDAGVLRAFRIYEAERRWEPLEYRLTDD